MLLPDRATRPPKAGALLLRLAIFALAVAVVAHGLEWGDVSRCVRDARPAPLLLVVALNGVMMAIRAARLWLLLAPWPVTIVGCLQAILSSSAINNVLPLRGGDIARLWMLERSAGVPKATGVAVTLVERVVDIAALALLVIPAALALPSQRWAVIAGAAVLAGAPIALVILKVLMTAPSVPRAGAALPSVWREKLDGFRRFVDAGAPAWSSPRTLARVTALSAISWTVEATMVVTCASALHLHVPAALAIVVLLGINLALVLPSTPSNAGPFEAAAVVVLGAGGVAKTQAVAFALAYHVVQVLPVTVVGLIVAARVYGRRPSA